MIEGRGICSHCGGEFNLRSDGAVRAHGGARPCLGSGWRPAEGPREDRPPIEMKLPGGLTWVKCSVCSIEMLGTLHINDAGDLELVYNRQRTAPPPRENFVMVRCGSHSTEEAA